MTSSIKKLWYGNIVPQEDGIFNKTEFIELHGYMSRHREVLEATMTSEQMELYERFMVNRNDYDSLQKQRRLSMALARGDDDA